MQWTGSRCIILPGTGNGLQRRRPLCISFPDELFKNYLGCIFFSSFVPLFAILLLPFGNHYEERTNQSRQTLFELMQSQQDDGECIWEGERMGWRIMLADSLARISPGAAHSHLPRPAHAASDGFWKAALQRLLIPQCQKRIDYLQRLWRPAGALGLPSALSPKVTMEENRGLIYWNHNKYLLNKCIGQLYLPRNCY